MVDTAADSDSALKLLNRCPANALPQLIHEVIDEICGDKDVKFNKYEQQWNIGEWTRMIRDLKSFISARSDQVASEAVSQDVQQSIQQCISIRSEDLNRHLIDQTCAISETYLKDFDWTAKFVLGSDSIASLKTPLLLLSLELKQVKDSKIVNIELTKEDLSKLINTLETAQKNMMELKV